MEVYLNIAETGIGTYGVNAGAQRYFGKDASNLARQEAARIAAVLPLPKKREAIAPGGFTRRYGNSIAARIRVVQRDGLDACLRGDLGATNEREEAPEKAAPSKPKAAPPAPQPERIEDYINPADSAPNASVAQPSAPVEITPPPVVEPAEINGM